MSGDVAVKNGMVIPAHELEITTSRAGGPGGQHVNRTDTRVTVRWNIKTTTALNEEQRARVLNNLQSRLTSEGELVLHASATRSQQQNKEAVLARLAAEVSRALYVPKKRKATQVSKAAKALRVQQKRQHSSTKALRSKKIQYD